MFYVIIINWSELFEKELFMIHLFAPILKPNKKTIIKILINKINRGLNTEFGIKSQTKNVIFIFVEKK